jgi:branched-chain amino acid aminotransferase
VTPVREIDDRAIGIGRPGPVTQRLQARYQAIVRNEVANYSHWLTPIL